jgi:hypothetical protein
VGDFYEHFPKQGFFDSFNGWFHRRAGELAEKTHSAEPAFGAESPRAGAFAPARPCENCVRPILKAISNF